VGRALPGGGQRADTHTHTLTHSLTSTTYSPPTPPRPSRQEGSGLRGVAVDIYIYIYIYIVILSLYIYMHLSEYTYHMYNMYIIYIYTCIYQNGASIHGRGMRPSWAPWWPLLAGSVYIHIYVLSHMYVLSPIVRDIYVYTRACIYTCMHGGRCSRGAAGWLFGATVR
jgi:hypothetical protein